MAYLEKFAIDHKQLAKPPLMQVFRADHASKAVPTNLRPRALAKKRYQALVGKRRTPVLEQPKAGAVASYIRLSRRECQPIAVGVAKPEYAFQKGTDHIYKLKCVIKLHIFNIYVVCPLLLSPATLLLAFGDSSA